MYFDRFDVCTAWYLFLSNYHEGQNSEKYKRLSKMCFYYKPSPMLSVDRLNENERAIYDSLVAQENVITKARLRARRSR